MNKKFDPEITKGPWMLSDDSRIAFRNLQDIGTIICTERTSISVSQRVLLSMNTHFDFKEDLKAISAVPEMLEVVNTARSFLKEWITTGAVFDMEEEDQVSFWNLFKAMKRLNEIHGDEVINK